MVERKTYIEGTFGLGKELHGLRRTRFRGTWRVQIQLWLTAAAMNIKRAVKRRAQLPNLAGAPQLLFWLEVWCLSASPIAPRIAQN